MRQPDTDSSEELLETFVSETNPTTDSLGFWAAVQRFRALYHLGESDAPWPFDNLRDASPGRPVDLG